MRTISYIAKAALFAALLSSAASMVSAQSIPTTEERIVFDVSPEFPRGNQTVTIEAESYQLDINRAFITWYVNGVAAASGAGKKLFTVSSGDLGTKTVVAAVAQTAAGQAYQKEITIQPADVDLVWEAEGYAPPFYRGKPLHVAGGDLRVVAMPSFVQTSGRVLDPAGLVYTWKREGTIMAADSGFGKNVFMLKSSTLNTMPRVSVEVSSPGKELRASATERVQAGAPKVLLYEEDPLMGPLYERALPASISMGREELTVIAAPYFFSKETEGALPDLLFAWRINGKKSGVADRRLTVRSGAAPGRAGVAVQVSSQARALQSAARSFSVAFGKTAVNPFGL
jgi:hypothetical protein